MDHEARAIQETVRAPINDLAVRINQDQIGASHQRKRSPQRIHPKVVRQDGIPERNVPREALVKGILGKDAERESEAALEVFAFLLLVGEFGRRGDFLELDFGAALGDFCSGGICSCELAVLDDVGALRGR